MDYARTGTMCQVRPDAGNRDVERTEAVTRGTGNVFADLGFADAPERQAKLRLAHALNQVLEGGCHRWMQPRYWDSRNPRSPRSVITNLRGFSVERLMNLLAALDQDVDIVIRRKPRSRRAARVNAVAA
jgi:hypothetical protein